MRVEIDIFFSETTLPAVFDGIGLQNDAVITFQSLYHLCYYLLFVLLYDTHAYRLLSGYYFCKGGPWNFQFEVKFYPVDPTLLHEELTRW